MKVVALLRVSTDDQSNGLDAQRDAISAWAAARGAEIVSWHEERGVSGKLPIDRRTGLLVAINAVETHDAKALVAHKRDRVSRDTLVTLLAERELARHGAVLMTVVGDVEGTGPEAVFMRRILDAVAELERSMIAARTRAALQAKKSRGQRVGSVPIGFTEVNGMLQVNVEESKAVALAKSLAAEGVGMREIGRRLDSEGLRTRSGKPWQPVQIGRMINA